MVDRRAPSPKSSDKMATCEPLPKNPMDDQTTKHVSPIKMQSPDRADAPALLFADDELCVERKPMEPHVRGTALALSRSRSPSLSPAVEAAARRLEKCRLSPGEPPMQAALPAECKRFAVPRCKPAEIECPPLYDEFTQPPTESSEEYLTKPMRLPPLRTDLDFVDTNDKTVFAI